MPRFCAGSEGSPMGSHWIYWTLLLGLGGFVVILTHDVFVAIGGLLDNDWVLLGQESPLAESLHVGLVRPLVAEFRALRRTPRE